MTPLLPSLITHCMYPCTGMKFPSSLHYLQCIYSDSKTSFLIYPSYHCFYNFILPHILSKFFPVFLPFLFCNWWYLFIHLLRFILFLPFQFFGHLSINFLKMSWFSCILLSLLALFPYFFIFFSILFYPKFCLLFPSLVVLSPQKS